MSSAAGPGHTEGVLTADRDGLTLRPTGDLPAVVDVLFDGRRTLSSGRDDAVPTDDGAWRIPWPPALAAALTGVATVSVRDSVTTDVLATAEVLFATDVAVDPGTAPRLDLRDAQGRWLSVNKWGRLAPSFDGMDATGVQSRLLDRLQQLVHDLEDLGTAPFLCYGTLLGVVRDGRLIAHDDDADVAYLSAHHHPADVAIENFRLEARLRERGYAITRHSAGHLQIPFEVDGALDHYIDIFTALEVDGRTYLCFHVGADGLDLSRRREVELGGHTFPVPVEAEGLLAATYGPHWRVPDPSFRFTTPPEVRSRLNTWMGEFHMQRDYWQDFYASPDSQRVPRVESSFARWVDERLDGAAAVIDVGTGTARDARFFASKGRRVVGVDYSHAAVQAARELSEAEGWPSEFREVNLGDLHAVGSLVADLDWAAGWHLYARFLVHAIDDSARANLWVLAGAVVRAGGECWLEFRTDRDEQEQHVFGEHFRRYLAPEQVRDELAAHGMAVLESVHSRGLAVHGQEDPWVARLRVGSAG